MILLRSFRVQHTHFKWHENAFVAIRLCLLDKDPIIVRNPKDIFELLNAVIIGLISTSIIYYRLQHNIYMRIVIEIKERNISSITELAFPISAWAYGFTEVIH